LCEKILAQKQTPLQLQLLAALYVSAICFVVGLGLLLRKELYFSSSGI